MSKYEINIGTSILSIPNVRTSQTTLNSLFAINPSGVGTTYPLQVINQDGTSGNETVIGVGHAPLGNGNANSTLVSHKYFGSNNAGNYSYFGLSGTGKPNLIFTNNATATINNCNLVDFTSTAFGRRISLYGTIADTTTFQYDGFGSAASTLVYNVATTTNNHVFYAATSSTARTELFRVAGNGVVSIPATGSLSLGTPLAPASGGTGLNAVGTPGQYLASNGTTLNWVNPSAGTGSVTSVSLAVDSTLNTLFTNTGSGTITTTGAFTLSLATAPTIVNATAVIPSLALTNNGTSAGTVRLLDCFAPNINTATGTGYARFGASTARFGYLRFYPRSTSTATFVVLGATHEGAALGGQIRIYADDVTPSEFPNSGGLTVQGPVTANAGLSTTTITASGLVSANAGLSTTTITASGLVSANAGLSATSTTTNGINLSSNITEGIRITSSAASLNAVTLGCYATGVPDSTPIQFGFANTTGDQAKLNFSYTSANSPLNFMTLQMGAAIFKMSNSTSTASTLNTPLTVTGLVTGTNLSATSFTASRVASIDASKNLVSTDQALLRLAASNTDYSLLGSSSPDGSTNTRIVVSGNSRAGFAGEIYYVATGATGSHIWWTGGATEKMKLDVNGSLTVVDTVKAKPRYGTANKTANQTIPANGIGVPYTALSWIDQTSYTGLNSNGVQYTNSYGYQVFVQVSYIVVWDATILGGGNIAAVRKNGSTIYHGFTSIRTGDTFGSVNSATTIVPLSSGDYFEIVVYNETATTLDVVGNAYLGAQKNTQFSYYILN